MYVVLSTQNTTFNSLYFNTIYEIYQLIIKDQIVKNVAIDVTPCKTIAQFCTYINIM